MRARYIESVMIYITSFVLALAACSKIAKKLHAKPLSERVCLSRDLWRRNMHVLTQRRIEIEKLNTKIEMLKKRLSTEKTSCTKLVLQERVICSKKVCPVPKADYGVAIALGICIPSAIGLGVGGYYVGRGSR